MSAPIKRHERQLPPPPTRRAQVELARRQERDVQRTRILSAVIQIASEGGPESATVAQVIRRAGVSKATFYGLFEDRSDCIQAAFEDAVALAADRAGAAYRAERRWVDRVRAGLYALLELLDEQPDLARLCIIQAVAAGPATLTRRREVLTDLARVIDDGRGARAGRQVPPLTAEGVVGGALGVIHARLLGPDPHAVIELLNPLMGMIVLPYLGEAAALRELSRPAPISPVPPRLQAKASPLNGFNMRLTYRTIRVLAAIDARPGSSNSEIAARAGVQDPGQISKLLARLARLELAENTGGRKAGLEANAWTLTDTGREALRTGSGLR
jgi:AcrR family transcriptional regulator